jgi:PAS domain-containing protein
MGQNRVESERLVLTALSQMINLSGEKIEGDVGAFLRILGEFFHADRTYFMQFSDKGGVTGSSYEWCAKGIGPQMDYLKAFFLDVFSWGWEKLTRLEKVNIPRVADLPPEAFIEKRILRALDIQSLLLIPLNLGGNFAGLLGLDSVRREKIWDEEEIALLKGAGEAIVNVLAHNKVERTLKNSFQQIERIKRQWESAADSLPELVFMIDRQGLIIRANRTVERWRLGSVKDIKGRKIYDLLRPSFADLASIFETYLPRTWEKLAEGHTVKWEFFDRALEQYLSIQIRPISILIKGDKRVSFAVVVINNVTKGKTKEKEQEKLVHELKDCLSKIKTLKGLLPICASCKKIRDDRGKWNEIELYIRDRTEAEFSHGICPECMKKLYPDFDKG